MGACRSIPLCRLGAGADTFHCSFDTGWCGLQQDRRSDDFDWRRLSGGTLTFDTGPECDPLNCHSGSYIYIESSRPRQRRDKARLRTPLLHGEGSRCLEFYWHMYGTGMGNLIVKLRQLNGSEVTVWSKAGSHGNQWHFEQVDLQVSPRLYKLVFEGMVGRSYTSDAALDNIEIYTGGCHGVVHNDCTFQHTLCSWQNVGQRAWQRHHGNTPTPGTGPIRDHTNSSEGVYLYVESSRTLPDETSRLRSGLMAGNRTGYCLQFWYHMRGTQVGVLSVRSTTNTTPGGGSGVAAAAAAAAAASEERILWQRSGDAGDVWHHHLLYFISPAQREFQIIFEARLVGGSEGDVALDDIVVHAGQCETPVHLSLH
ncbi:hypothetical protein ACOMHN_047021 [Nucella lapillus]